MHERSLQVAVTGPGDRDGALPPKKPGAGACGGGGGDGCGGGRGVGAVHVRVRGLAGGQRQQQQRAESGARQLPPLRHRLPRGPAGALHQRPHHGRLPLRDAGPPPAAPPALRDGGASGPRARGQLRVGGVRHQGRDGEQPGPALPSVGAGGPFPGGGGRHGGRAQVPRQRDEAGAVPEPVHLLRGHGQQRLPQQLLHDGLLHHVSGVRPAVVRRGPPQGLRRAAQRPLRPRRAQVRRRRRRQHRLHPVRARQDGDRQAAVFRRRRRRHRYIHRRWRQQRRRSRRCQSEADGRGRRHVQRHYQQRRGHLQQGSAVHGEALQPEQQDARRQVRVPRHGAGREGPRSERRRARVHGAGPRLLRRRPEQRPDHVPAAAAALRGPRPVHLLGRVPPHGGGEQDLRRQGLQLHLNRGCLPDQR